MSSKLGRYNSYRVERAAGRLGSHPIQVVERDTVVTHYTQADLDVTEHAARFIHGVGTAEFPPLSWSFLIMV